MDKKEKSIGKNYIYNLVYQILVLIVPFVLTPYVSRVLSPEGIGEFSYGTTIVGYFVLAGNLGVATYGQLEIAKVRKNVEESSKIFWEIFFTRFVTMMTSLIIYLIYVLYGHSCYKMMYQVLVVQILASVLDISWLLQGLEEFKKIVFRNIIIKFAGVILVLLFVKNEGDLYKYAFIMNIVTLLGNLSLWGYLFKFLVKVKMNKFRLFSHLKRSVIYFIPTIATTLYLTVDKTMIEWFSETTAENGFYEQAQKIEQMAVTAVTSLSVVTMPRMALLYKEKKHDEIREIFDKSIRFVLFLAIPMCIGLVMVSDLFIPIYLGDGYEKSSVLLKIFSLLIIVVGLNNAFGKQILMPFGQQRKYNVAVIVGAIVNFCLNFLLIPKLYSIGAAIASVIAESIILLFFMQSSRAYYNGVEVIKISKNYLVSALIMAISIKLINIFLSVGIFALIIQVFVGIFVYLLILFLMQDKLILEGFNLIKNKMGEQGDEGINY